LRELSVSKSTNDAETITPQEKIEDEVKIVVNSQLIQNPMNVDADGILSASIILSIK